MNKNYVIFIQILLLLIEVISSVLILFQIGRPLTNILGIFCIIPIILLSDYHE